MAFDRKVFEKDFNQRLDKLGSAEASVRSEINVLSRTVLEAVHATEQIGYVNQMLVALTPVNRNAAVEYFRHFAGFHYDEVSRLFTKKSKKRYEAAHKQAMDFLADPLNNLFSWAQRQKLGRAETEFVVGDFLKSQHKAFTRAMQKARDHGIGQKELFAAMFKTEEGKPGIDVNALVSVLEAMDVVEVKQETEQEALI